MREREMIDCSINFFKGVKDDLSIKAYNMVRGATRLYSSVCKGPWRRAWKLTPVFLPGGYHGQKIVAGCGP